MTVETKQILGKGELIDLIAEKTKFSKKDSGLALNAMLSAIEEQLSKGNSIRLIPFGAFEVRQRGARTGRNPRSGEKIEISERKVPAFKPGKALKDAVK